MAIMRAYATKGLCETDQEPSQAKLGWGSGRRFRTKAMKKNKNNTVPSGHSGHINAF